MTLQLVAKTFNCISSIITEEANPNRQDTCGCGINVATLNWVKRYNEKQLDIWEVLIEWLWLSTLIVPYNTDGKVRVGKCRLIRKLTKEEAKL